jgi:hypothetical protein
MIKFDKFVYNIFFVCLLRNWGLLANGPQGLVFAKAEIRPWLL